jgi:alpha-amylase
MRNLKFAGLTERRGDLSVPFVDNHDTDSPASPVWSPVINLKMLAYAYILMRDKGYPCIFWKDFYEYNLGGDISRLISLRKRYAFGASFEHPETDSDVYVYSRFGDATHSGLVLFLNDGPKTTRRVATHFKTATLVEKTGASNAQVHTDANGRGDFPVPARSYAVWVPAGS